VSAVVSDSSPLNYLALLSDFDLLRRIYGNLVIPPAVHHEVVERGLQYPVGKAVHAALGGWITVAAAPDAQQVISLRREHRLDQGEGEAILVAESLGKPPLLMDERRGVRCARQKGLTVIRTPLIYADAKHLGLIRTVREKLDALRARGFRLSDQHYAMILKELNEL
jgi:predicted nucleic acid-binding protein